MRRLTRPLLILLATAITVGFAGLSFLFLLGLERGALDRLDLGIRHDAVPAWLLAVLPDPGVTDPAAVVAAVAADPLRRAGHGQ